MGLGKKLALILEDRNMTVVELANAINVAPTTIYSLIQRDGNKLDIDLLLKICKELNIKPESLSVIESSSEPDTIAAHFDGKDFTEEELKKIEEYAKLLLLARMQTEETE